MKLKFNNYTTGNPAVVLLFVALVIISPLGIFQTVEDSDGENSGMTIKMRLISVMFTVLWIVLYFSVKR